MTREEGLRLTNEFSRLTVPGERNVDYASIAGMSNGQVKATVLQDETSYVHLQQDMSLALLDVMESYTGEEKLAVRDFFNPPGLFDGLVTVLCQEFRQKPMRPHLSNPEARKAIIHQMVEKITEALGDRKARDFSEVC